MRMFHQGLTRRAAAASALAALLTLVACGGGGDPQTDGSSARSEQAQALDAAPSASSTALVVAAQNFIAPDASTSYRAEQLADGVLRLRVTVGDGSTLVGDLRAVYFHLAGNNTTGLTISGADVTNRQLGVNSVVQVGGADTKLSRMSGVQAAGGFDVGVEFGTRASSGADDVQTSVIELTRPGGLTLADLRLQFDGEGEAYVGVVARAVGDPAGRRRDSINSVFVPGFPVPPPPPPARVYDVGAAHLCAAGASIQPQSVGCVGDNSAGQLGPNPNTYVLAATQVATGVGHSCAIGSALVGGVFVADVACWGAGVVGAQLAKPQLAGEPRLVAAGNGFTCVATATGVDPATVQCWTATGDASALNAVTYAELGGIVGLAAGDSRACAVVSNGDVLCWDTTTTGAVPTLVAGNIEQLDAFGDVACGATFSGGVNCWSLSAGTAPLVPTGFGGVAQVAVGDGFACAIVAGGPSCWATGAVTPAVLTPPASVASVRNIEAGGGTACAQVAGPESVVCWGAINATLFGSIAE